MVSDDENYVTIYNVKTNDIIIEHKCIKIRNNFNESDSCNFGMELNLNLILCQC